MSHAFPIRAGQIKAARAILDWSQEDLALASRLSVATIRNIEQGNYPRHATMNLVREALEHAGIEFLDCDGVKRRVEGIIIYQGINASDNFLSDIIKNANETGIIAISKSQKIFAASLGLPENLERLEDLGAILNAKCLVSELVGPTLAVPVFELRTIPKFHVGPTCYFVYQDRYAVVVSEDDKNFRYIVFKSPALAHSYRQEFSALWDIAFPINHQAPQIAHRIRA